MELDIIIWLLGLVVIAVAIGGVILPYLVGILWTLGWLYILWYYY